MFVNFIFCNYKKNVVLLRRAHVHLVVGMKKKKHLIFIYEEKHRLKKSCWRTFQDNRKQAQQWPNRKNEGATKRKTKSLRNKNIVVNMAKSNAIPLKTKRRRRNVQQFQVILQIIYFFCVVCMLKNWYVYENFAVNYYPSRKLYLIAWWLCDDLNI